jgi:colanic acid biosynthesis glycosyl transferase WcaI
VRILVHDYSGHPFQVELSRALAESATVLHLTCPSFLTPKGPVTRQADEPRGFEVDQVALGSTFLKYSLLRRPVQEIRYARRLVRRARRFGPDVVLSSNTPLLAQAVFQTWCRLSRVRHVFWQQDIYSVAMGPLLRDKLPPVLGGLAARLAVAVEAYLLRAADAVVVISDDFRATLDRWRVPSERVTTIENWAPLDDIRPGDRDNAWSRAHGLTGKTVLLYSGTLGMKHDPSKLLRLAQAFGDEDGVAVVVCSEGMGADWLAERATGVPNLHLLGFQPYDVFPDVLASADVLLVLLNPDAGAFSVPSKVLTYHCACRPILASVPLVNLAARLIEEAGSGVVVDADDPDALVAEARRLVASPELRSAMGRAARSYAEATFGIDGVKKRFQAVIDSATGTVPAAAGPRPRRG